MTFLTYISQIRPNEKENLRVSENINVAHKFGIWIVKDYSSKGSDNFYFKKQNIDRRVIIYNLTAHFYNLFLCTQ